jgi:hypothetical protein
MEMAWRLNKNERGYMAYVRYMLRRLRGGEMNRIRCAKCKELLHSKHVHDWVGCGCGAVYVDGGDEYCRLGGHAEDIIMVDDDGNERPFKEAK